MVKPRTGVQKYGLKRGLKWKARHELWRQTQNGQRSLPPLRTLPGLLRREQEVLQAAEAKARGQGWLGKSYVFCDVSQSIDRAPGGRNCCSCLSASGFRVEVLGFRV